MTLTATKTRQQLHTAAIEISRFRLNAAVLHSGKLGESATVRTRELVWGHSSTSLLTETGTRELAAAFKRLASEERLAGTKVCLTLSGEFCVTRVVTGTADEVRRELAQLEERSALYLTLGNGPKALAGSVQAIDARHQHALLTVTNSRVLDTIVQTAKAASLEIELIEPSLVALCRVVGELGADANGPTIIVHWTEGALEIGISYCGQLLLEYRPGGRATPQQIAEIIGRHLPRLNRFCQRHHGYVKGTIEKIFLSGSEESLDEVREGFKQFTALEVETLDPAQIRINWEFSGDGAQEQYGVALGTLLLASSDTPRNGPNLMERLRAQDRPNLLRECWRATWPVAVALFLALVAWGLTLTQAVSYAELEAQLLNLAPARARIANLQEQMSLADVKIHHLSSIRDQLKHPSWSEVLTRLANCLPHDVWLESVGSQADGALVLIGASFGDHGVVEFVRFLRNAPGLAHVDLEQTNSTVLANGPATRFTINCNLSEPNDPSQKSN